MAVDQSTIASNAIRFMSVDEEVVASSGIELTWLHEGFKALMLRCYVIFEEFVEIWHTYELGKLSGDDVWYLTYHIYSQLNDGLKFKPFVLEDFEDAYFSGECEGGFGLRMFFAEAAYALAVYKERAKSSDADEGVVSRSRRKRTDRKKVLVSEPVFVREVEEFTIPEAVKCPLRSGERVVHERCITLEEREFRLAKLHKRREKKALKRLEDKRVRKEREKKLKDREQQREVTRVVKKTVSGAVRAVVSQVNAGSCRTSDRVNRDSIQRAAARRKSIEERKLRSKAAREREVLKARDKRVPIFQSGVSLDPSTAIALGIGVGIGVAGSAALYVGINKLSQIARSAGVSLSTLSTAVGGTLDTVTHSTDALTALITEVRQAFISIRDRIGTALWVAPACALTFLFSRMYLGQQPLLADMFVSVLVGLIGGDVGTYVSEFFRGRDVEYQSGAIEDLIPVLSKIMASTFCFSVLRTKKQNYITEFLKAISGIERAAGGCETLSYWIVSAFEKIVNYARSMFGMSRVQVLTDLAPQVTNWKSAVDQLLKDVRTDCQKISTDMAFEFQRLQSEGFALKSIFYGKPIESHIDRYLSLLATEAQPFIGSISAAGNCRMEPPMMVLYGTPGIGKTTLATYLCSAVLLHSGIVKPDAGSKSIKSQIWQKGTSEYWNGYTSQACIVMDDCFQARMVAGNLENDFISVIRMVSTWAYPLNFADLNSKGKFMFNSKFIFGTTNCASIENEAAIVLNSPEAVSRRISHPYKLTVKPEYQLVVGTEIRLDYAKFQAELDRCMAIPDNELRGPLDRFPWYIWQVQRHDFLRGITNLERRELRDVIEEVSASLRTRFVQHGTASSMLDVFINGFQEYRPEEVNVEMQSGKLLESCSNIAHAVAKKSIGFLDVQLKLADKVGRWFDGDWVTDDDVKDDPFFHSLFETIEEEKRIMKAINDAVRGIRIAVVASAILAAAYLFANLIRSYVRDDKGYQSNRPDRRPQKQSGTQLAPSVPQAYSVVRKGYANTYKMYTTTTTGQLLVFGQVTMVNGHLGFYPKHYKSDIEESLADGSLTLDSVLCFRNAVVGTHKVDFTVRKFLEFPTHHTSNSEVCFFNNRMYQAHKNIEGSFLKEADLVYLAGRMAQLEVCEIESFGALNETNEVRQVCMTLAAVKNNLSVGTKTVDRYVSYSAATKRGDCGAVLSLVDGAVFHNRFFVGAHIAGSTNGKVGFAMIVTQEMIAEARGKLGTINDRMAEIAEQSGRPLMDVDDNDDSIVAQFHSMGSFQVIGKVDKPVIISPKTSYFKTEYGECGFFDDTYGPYLHAPAHMSPICKGGVWFNPMFNAIKPYASSVRSLDFPQAKLAMHTALRPLSQLTRLNSRRIFTFEEAVSGIPQYKFRAIPRNTAAGYPYVLDYVGGKKEFFGTSDVYEFKSEACLKLKERVNFVLEQAAEGNRLDHVFVDFLKDELRSPAKNDAVATRLISSAPLDYTVAWRMLFGAFSVAVMENNVSTGMAPGVCCYSDWDRVVTWLKQKGSDCFDGDFKNYDASQQPEVHGLILDYINAWYNDSPENQRARKVLWQDLVHSRHIGGPGKNQRYIYQWNKCMPSGHPFTTIVNSIYTLFMLVCAYGKCCGDVTTFWDNVAALTYGDDNVCNVDSKIVHKFNQRTVAEALGQIFGMVYTPSNKGDTFIDVQPIEALSFLKRGFRREGGHWMCPLEIPSFLYTVYWCKNKRLQDEIILDNFERVLEEASMHPPEVWDAVVSRVKDEFDHLGYISRVPIERKQYQDRVLGYTDAWY